MDNYDDDLIHVIEGWLTKGDQVVVMLDANAELAHSIQGNFRHELEAIGLKELIMSKHPLLKPPPTRNPRFRASTIAISLEVGLVSG